MSQLLDVVLRVTIYMQPIQFLLVMVTQILNIRVLCSDVLRASPSTYYLLGYAVSSIVYTCLVCPTQFLRGLHIDWANTYIGCKIYFYILFVPPLIARIMLVLASFDRFRSSSRTLRFHSASTKRTTRLVIISSAVLAAIYMLPMSAIYYFNGKTSVCLQYSNLLVSIYVFTQMAIFYIFSPLLMMIFGSLAIRNIRHYAVRTVPGLVFAYGRRTEGQLARMLILQTSVHLLLTVPFGVTYLMNAFDPSTRTPDVVAIRYILVMWQQCDYFMSFFLYICSGRVYRQQLFRILRSYRPSRSNHSPIRSPQTGVQRDLLLTAKVLLLIT